MNWHDRRIARLVAHRNRCLQFLKQHYPTLKAAKETKWYRQYTAAQLRINSLRRRKQPSSKDDIVLERLISLKLQ